MSLTIDERKERYYNIVLEKANVIYNSWSTLAIKSKKLVAQANEYAFNNRLKTDAYYRFQALVFTVALEIRIKKRYCTFFRRLFRLFAYYREQKALKTLKGLLGFNYFVDIREMIYVEAEKIIAMLSHLKNQQSTGGGKSTILADMMLEDVLNNFLQECLQEEEERTAESHLEAEQVDTLENEQEQLPMNTEDVKREKISVAELETKEQEIKPKKQTNIPKNAKNTEKQTMEMLDKDINEDKNVKKQAEKTQASPFIVSEVKMPSRESSNVSQTVPIFKQEIEGKTVTEKRDDSALPEEKDETKTEKGNGEEYDKSIRVEADMDRSPFPVFKGEKLGVVNTPGKIVDAPIEPLVETTLYQPMYVSEENKARIALNITMSKEEINAITQQLKTAANMQMESEEQAWREKISTANAPQATTSVKDKYSSPNQGAIVPGAKK